MISNIHTHFIGTRPNIVIIDVTGNRVATVISGKYYSKGKHTEVLNIDQLPVGIYLCYLQANQHVASTRLVVTR